MVDAVNAIQQSWDADEITANARKIQKLWTDNVYTVGLVQAPAALLVNKRVKERPSRRTSLHV